MMAGSDNKDDDLMAEIARAMREVTDVPAAAFEAAMTAFQFQNVDEELEWLTMLYDSSTEDETVLRGTAYTTARYLTFQSGDLSLEIEINAENVLGQVVPSQIARISVVTGAGEFSGGESDDLGSFVLARPAAGPIRLTCKTKTTSLLTGWISI